MAIHPIVDSEGRIKIRGAVRGFTVFDANAGLILLLDLEQFEKAVQMDEVDGWDALVRAEAAQHPTQKDDDQAQPQTSTAIVHLQVAVPYDQALKLGWGLMEAAKDALTTPPGSALN